MALYSHTTVCYPDLHSTLEDGKVDRTRETIMPLQYFPNSKVGSTPVQTTPNWTTPNWTTPLWTEIIQTNGLIGLPPFGLMGQLDYPHLD